MGDSTVASQQNEATFQGVDENMELDKDDQAELMKFETVQTSKEIEFDKIKISDVITSCLYLSSDH